MKKIKLYRYARENGGVTVSPNKPNGEYTELSRIVADEGKGFDIGKTDTHGKPIYANCLDVENPEAYTEVDIPKEETGGAEEK